MFSFNANDGIVNICQFNHGNQYCSVVTHDCCSTPASKTHLVSHCLLCIIRGGGKYKHLFFCLQQQHLSFGLCVWWKNVYRQKYHYSFNVVSCNLFFVQAGLQEDKQHDFNPFFTRAAATFICVLEIVYTVSRFSLPKGHEWIESKSVWHQEYSEALIFEAKNVWKAEFAFLLIYNKTFMYILGPEKFCVFVYKKILVDFSSHSIFWATFWKRDIFPLLLEKKPTNEVLIALYPASTSIKYSAQDTLYL